MHHKFIPQIISSIALVFITLVATISCDPKKDNEPTILITNPSSAFMQSINNLRVKKYLPKHKIIFLLHDKQQQRILGIEKTMQEFKDIKYRILRLTDFPAHPGFPKFVTKFNGIYPDKKMERFLLSTKRFIPKSWAKVFKQAVESSDAYFVPGGSNIPAKLYGKKQFVEGLSRTPSRSLYELSLLAFLLEGKNAYLKNKPEYLIIGFCYGFQALNVAMGGTLYQSIPIEAYGHYYVSDMKKLDPNLMHMNFHLAQYPTVEELYRGWFHRIKIYQKSKFILKLPDVYILSNHHQGAAKLGKNLIVLAASIDDKIPEILAHKQFPNVIGLQGHIERQFALDRLSQFPENTRKFHEHFWTTVSQVLMHNFQTRQKK